MDSEKSQMMRRVGRGGASLTNSALLQRLLASASSFSAWARARGQAAGVITGGQRSQTSRW
eukprot:COSAG01_NODE_35655_length_528_cov_6.291375_2_plen_61_part_00